MKVPSEGGSEVEAYIQRAPMPPVAQPTKFHGHQFLQALRLEVRPMNLQNAATSGLRVANKERCESRGFLVRRLLVLLLTSDNVIFGALRVPLESYVILH